jgi:isocitrate dehydrogenase kinase/phosphatase
VFSMPGFDVVFKVIRDRFPEPKRTTREKVMERYDLVFRHDRAGRLVDAQSFDHLSFARERFSPEVLRELLETAGETVSVVGDRVEIRQLYTERRIAPLNLYLREAAPEAARAAVLDYGQAIRDLAKTGVFPGDVLPKNFGVSRHGRVIFYDYDELALVSECRFRELPEPTDPEDETRAEPWFFVADNDIFPEELLPFLGLPPPLREAFVEAHGDLLGVRFWRGVQERLRAGEIPDILPYRADQRLSGWGGTAQFA